MRGKPMQTLLVTGTDTGVGKTVVACLLVNGLKRAGLRVSVMKPAESGCGEAVVATDAAQLGRAAGREASCPFRYELSLAPAVAAKREGRPPVTLDRILSERDAAAVDSDVLVVEGTGGLLVPLAPRCSVRDLAVALEARVLIVARSGLGTINHSLLSVEAARTAGLPVVGVVLNSPRQVMQSTDPSVADNARVIAEAADCPVWGPLPYVDDVARWRATAWETVELTAAARPIVEHVRAVLGGA